MTVQKVGMNYSGVESGARLAGIEVTPDMHQGLRIIEAEMLNVDAERLEKSSKEK